MSRGTTVGDVDFVSVKPASVLDMIYVSLD